MIATKIKLAIAGAAIVAAFASGVWVRDSFCDAAKAKADLADERLAHAATRTSLESAQKTATHTKSALDMLQQKNAAREETVNDRPADAPAVPRCHLDRGKLDWLHRISPD